MIKKESRRTSSPSPSSESVANESLATTTSRRSPSFISYSATASVADASKVCSLCLKSHTSVRDGDIVLSHGMKLSSAGLSQQSPEGDKNFLNSELWHICAAPLVSLPADGSHVVYFSQGHSKQIAISTNKEVDAHIPNYPSLPPQLICQLHNVTMHAGIETDDVYAQMTLQPLSPQEQKDVNFLPADLGAPSKQPMNYFCKTLTASITSTYGGFSQFLECCILGDKNFLNSELWHICAAPLVSLPADGSHVVYFSQGHSKQAGIETDDVYAQMTLQPLSPQEQKDVNFLPADLGAPSKQPMNYFCKTLTASITSTYGGFSQFLECCISGMPSAT
ncbi:unnamed protein product [Fraxinus pennsylvanica]|uniref:Uncharacterized protein n=1 Tax=Fraxinus pennsylvanica TaxID=56036 RepID=A0AAD2EC96_9LAMI|nr:unnamed protein product [Fraxinus pennsylvanica]